MSEKILVVDDDYSLRNNLELNLQHQGFDTLGVASGEIALQLLWDWIPDLIILDIMMPSMDGFEATKRIREFSDVPIIMLTAKADDLDIVKGLDVGADDYIIKPFSIGELLARIRALLRRSSSHASEPLHQEIYEHKDLVIDADQARVTLDGEEIQLTAIEFQLLIKLVTSQGKPVSREELLCSVWGPEYREDRNVLWVAISRLRKKIERNSENPVYVVHHRNLGYTMA
jgi:DNA-binding response OmpR family regulator